jgi:two-component system, chemotaxis family, chemotaxis protein CheY
MGCAGQFSFNSSIPTNDLIKDLIMNDTKKKVHEAHQLVTGGDIDRKRTGQVLFVDDKANEEMATVIRSLQRLGYTVEVSLNAAGAFGKLNAQIFDVIVTDFNMPRVDGLNFFRKIRSTYPELPVIMLTGVGNSSLAVSFIKERGSNYLSKPVSALCLDEAIADVIEHNPDQMLSSLEKLIEEAKKHFHGSAQSCREIFGGADSIPSKRGKKQGDGILSLTKEMSHGLTSMANMIGLHQQQSKLRVHLVEAPQDTNTEILIKQLEEKGYQLSKSSLRNPPSLMDISALVWYLRSPLEEGREKIFWESLREQHPELPVVMIAAQEIDSANLAVSFLKQGGADYLSEPFAVQELYQKTLRILRIQVQSQTNGANKILSHIKTTIQKTWQHCMQIKKSHDEIDKEFGPQKRRIESAVMRVRNEMKEAKELISTYEGKNEKKGNRSESPQRMLTSLLKSEEVVRRPLGDVLQ